MDERLNIWNDCAVVARHDPAADGAKGYLHGLGEPSDRIAIVPNCGIEFL